MILPILLVTIVALPFAGALIGALLPREQQTAGAWLAGLIAAFGLGVTIWSYPQITNGNVVRIDIPWISSLGLDLIFRLDGLSWLFCLLITGVGLLVVLYARYYMSPKDPVTRFFSFFLAFMGAMLGVVLSGNLIQLVLFWELTSITTTAPWPSAFARSAPR